MTVVLLGFEHGASGLTEAVVVTDTPALTSGVASVIEQLATKASRLSKTQIEALCKIKVVRSGWQTEKGRVKLKKLRRLGNATWIIGVKDLSRPPSKIEQKHIDRSNRDLNHRRGTTDVEYSWIRWGRKGKFAKQCREGDTLIQIDNGRSGKRRRVTRRLPVLLKRPEPKFTRFYTVEAPPESNEVSWSRFQGILKAAGYLRKVRPFSVRLLTPDQADAIDRRWTRARRAD
jgi:hypothetical protein